MATTNDMVTEYDYITGSVSTRQMTPEEVDALPNTPMAYEIADFPEAPE